MYLQPTVKRDSQSKVNILGIFDSVVEILQLFKKFQFSSYKFKMLGFFLIRMRNQYKYQNICFLHRSSISIEYHGQI